MNAELHQSCDFVMRNLKFVELHFGLPGTHTVVSWAQVHACLFQLPFRINPKVSLLVHSQAAWQHQKLSSRMQYGPEGKHKLKEPAHTHDVAS